MRGSKGVSLPAGGVDRERAGRDRCRKHVLDREEARERERGRDLVPFKQREAFLRRERAAGLRGCTSPIPISASAKCASGARSPEAPTEPCDGIRG
jgi:hypothetical protein